MEQALAWRNRPLKPFYGVVFPDALYVKMRQEGRVETRAVYVALGINPEGRKDVLALSTSANKGANFGLNVRTELRNCGVRDIRTTHEMDARVRDPSASPNVSSRLADLLFLFGV
jgi:putative transposase